MLRSSGLATTVGPQRSPLGLAADPGGLPLYKNGTVVGGVGDSVEARHLKGEGAGLRRRRESGRRQ